MSRCLTRRVAVLFALSVLLAVPWSIAEPREGRGAAPPVSIWSWLMSEIGCILDPGGCGQIDIGCVADPNGGCGPGPSRADIGCGLDPGGACGQ